MKSIISGSFVWHVILRLLIFAYTMIAHLLILSIVVSPLLSVSSILRLFVLLFVCCLSIITTVFIFVIETFCFCRSLFCWVYNKMRTEGWTDAEKI